MGYQALLFCPDEKLARVVNQVFGDLDFTIEHVNEPFSAVKKLMAQRYDAIVVDCENEQNASLLFKSARNSSSNQSSLALALVEGQAGVAKAYRIGANLVLTKPINVEQAKGTLRVARGLLRKNVDSPAATAATTAPTAAVPAAATPAPAKIAPAQIAASKAVTSTPVLSQETAKKYQVPEFEAPPAMVAEAATPVADAPVKPAEVVSAAPVQPAIASPVPQKPFPPVPPPAFQPPAAASAGNMGSAAAPAPAKEAATPAPTATPVEKKSNAPEFVGHATVIAAPAVATPSAPSQFEAPKFGALEANETAAASGGNKKIFMAIAAVAVIAVAAYFGWTKFGSKSTATQTASNPPAAAAPSSPAPAATVPNSAPSHVPSPSTTTPPVESAKPSATITNSPAIKIESEPVSEPVVKKPTAPAIVVKSTSPAKKTQAPPEDAAPQVPSPLGVAQDSEKHISNLMASTPVNLPKQAVSTLKISQGVSQGLLIKRVQPRYPQNALSMRVQGTVQMDATIDKEGNVKNLKVLSGDPVLARAASDAVHQWRYKPYYLDGEPVEIQTQITVNFKLPN